MEKKVLTKSIAQSLTEVEYLTELSAVSLMDDDAAEVLGHYRGEIPLALNCLEHLSDASAEFLSRTTSGLAFSRLSELSDRSAESFSHHRGELHFYGQTRMSNRAIDFLSRHQGEVLVLDNLSHMSDMEAEILSRHEGWLNLSELSSISDTGAKSLVRHPGRLWLPLDVIPESAVKILCEHPSFAS